MTATLLLAALAATDLSGPLVETRCAAIEQNHLYCPEDGREIFAQFIFWYDSEDGREVLAWCLGKPGMMAHKVSGEWCLIWLDNGTLRRVRAVGYLESWTVGHDPEVACREFMPVSQRRGLGK